MSIWTDVARQLPGFISAGSFDRDGLLLDGYAVEDDFHMEHAAATFVTIVQEAETAGNFLRQGLAREVQITYDEALFLLRRIEDSERGLLVGLACRSDTPLGRIRLTMDLLSDKLRGLAAASSASSRPLGQPGTV